MGSLACCLRSPATDASEAVPQLKKTRDGSRCSERFPERAG
jgi:hypothetical protein